jgi:serine/threonine protein kinase
MYSLGVIIFYLCTGNPLLNDRFMYMETRFERRALIGDTYSKELQDLVDKLLVHDPSRRLNCDQVLNHPALNNRSGEPF